MYTSEFSVLKALIDSIFFSHQACLLLRKSSVLLIKLVTGQLTLNNSQKRCPFLYRELACKIRQSRNIWSKFGLGVQNEAQQRLIEFCQENALVMANTFFQNTREDSTQGHHQMTNTEIRLIIFFAAKDGEGLYSQQKQDQELSVTQIMNSFLPNSYLNRTN